MVQIFHIEVCEHSGRMHLENRIYSAEKADDVLKGHRLTPLPI